MLLLREVRNSLGDILMKFLLATLCVLLATANLQAIQPIPLNEPTVSVWTLGVYEPLPAFTKSMDDDEFASWAKLHNEHAYFMARQRADEFNCRQSQITTSVLTEEFDNYGSLGGLFNFPQRGYSRTTQQYYSPKRWGGGPVLIINPYYRD